MTSRRHALLATLLLLVACGGSGPPATPPPVNPYAGTPPSGTAIAFGGGDPIRDGTGTSIDWKWVAFPDALCTDATTLSGFSTTGLAINWGTDANSGLVVFLQGGGACWDFLTCGGLGTSSATRGPFGPTQFAGLFASASLTNSWVHRANLPAALANATIVFVPYCTGDVHGGNAVTTYTAPGLPAVTWHHVGHANLMSFLKRLGPTFPTPGKLLVSGSSAGGFGALLDYPAFRWYWPNAKGYLLDDSGPPLIGNAVPAGTRAAMYASWNLGAALDYGCPGCRSDLSQGMVEVEQRWPNDRIALVSHLQDLTIREFFGTITASPPYVTPMDATVFHAQLGLLRTSVMDGKTNARAFYTSSPTATAHPALDNPAAVTSPGTGLTAWVQQMVSDDTNWVSLTDPPL